MVSWGQTQGEELIPKGPWRSFQSEGNSQYLDCGGAHKLVWFQNSLNVHLALVIVIEYK